MDTVVSRTMESLYQMYAAFKKSTPLPQLQQSEALKEIRTRTEALVRLLVLMCVRALASTTSRSHVASMCGRCCCSVVRQVAFVNAGANTVSAWLSEETRRQLARYDSMMMYNHA